MNVVKPKYRAALFDFDGTLTPSLPLWVKAFHIALRRYDVVVSDQEVIKRFFYRDWADIAVELQLKSVDEFKEQIHSGLREAFHDARLFPLVISLLTQCRAAGMHTALVTSAPKIVIDDVVPRLKLLELFDYIVCADDVKNFKPHPEPVLMTLAALSCDAAAAIMIGDSSVDILSGKAAGTATALFMPDDGEAFHHAETLRATQPDYIFSDHAELPEIMGL